MKLRPRHWHILVLLAVALSPMALGAVELRVQPGREKVRPYESALIQFRFSGADTRLSPAVSDDVIIRVIEREGGWVSRPFLNQPGGSDGGRSIAVLYTAPAQNGRYTLEGRYRSLRLEVGIEVTDSAPSYRPREAVSFGPESESPDFYRSLAERYAPVICQETWFEPKADYLVRFDYDGDWRGDNNWDNLPVGSSQAYVYYAVMETSTHYFLVYDFFHARRYSDDCSTANSCHENDSGGLVLTVRKDGSKYGRPQLMQTLAHNNLYSYTSDARIREGPHRIHGELSTWRESHPVVFVESGSHGVYSGSDREHSRFSVERMDFTTSTGVIYRYGGAAGRPVYPNDHEATYELLSAYDHWWQRATSRSGYESRTFDEYFRYAPYGNRPRTVTEEIARAFWGRKYSVNQARPFWGWHDTVTLQKKILATGQWALDPAYAVSVTLKLPAGTPYSLDYIFNPFLESGAGRGVVTAIPRFSRDEANGSAPAPVTAPPRPAGPAGERHVLSPPAERPSYKVKDKNGSLEFRARVDGTVYLHIRGDQIEVEYLSGRPMDEIRYRFSQPLPATEMEEVKLEDVEGRGSVRLLEWPNSGNQFTAKIRIQDDKAGTGIYKFKLAWKR